MSASFALDLFCDGDDCMKWSEGSTVCEGYPPSIMALRRKLARIGWTHSRGKDFCPECSMVRARGVKP